MISVTEAIKIVRKNTAPPAAETIALENAVGRILAADVFADMDLPPFDRSQMDGYAVKSADTAIASVKLKIVGEAAAGRGWRGELKTGEAVRIMTGAPVPRGADAVQKLEVTREKNDFVEIFESTQKGQNIILKASEIRQGAQVFKSGALITTEMIAALASFGYAQIAVGKRPQALILATGNELVGIDEQPQQDQIRNSNSLTLKIYAEKCGAAAQILPTASDDLENLKSQILNASQNCDVLILSGGVSVGKYDFTKAALSELGAAVLFDRIALRPGKPTVFAKLGETLVFGLPGNPVSAIVTFNLFARTALQQMQDAHECELETGFAVLTHKLKGAKERDSYLPAKLSIDEKGHLLAEPLKWGGSSDFISFARADAFVFVPRGETLEAQSVTKILFL